MSDLKHTKKSQKAFDELQAIGVPVLKNGWGGYFQISGESNGTEVWAEYWEDSYINPKIEQIVKKHGLLLEWHNPGVLCVYSD
ncbi:hypothetical protein F7Q91_02765 [Vibrio chagasii]|uniref:Uncharacterized protein n=1 Tax=Vibrio chagasii TaxID=170679 RepID=A0A7V7NWS3_9VIBR|nr:hypothetical protein [Vibrio chagasii]KAB0482342.1 hypothetical protein F7Q91_02765 [Vibrio chagasii]